MVPVHDRDSNPNPQLSDESRRGTANDVARALIESLLGSSRHRG